MLRKRLDTPELDRVIEEFALALEELRELARGLHPAALYRGLYAAVGALATRSPVPVEYDVVEGRLPEAIEVAAYYVIAESITNAVKHAQATMIRVLRVAEGEAGAVHHRRRPRRRHAAGFGPDRPARPRGGAARPAPGGQSTRSRNHDQRGAAAPYGLVVYNVNVSVLL